MKNFIDEYEVILNKCSKIARNHLIKAHPTLKFTKLYNRIVVASEDKDAGILFRYNASNGHWFEIIISLPSSRNYLKNIELFSVYCYEHWDMWEFGGEIIEEYGHQKGDIDDI
jgi:hypothetical protein